MKKLLLVAAIAALTSASALGANDPGSFGRDVRWLDVGKQTYNTYLYTTIPSNCTRGVTPPVRCVTITDPTAISTYTEQTISRIDLPAYATNSLLCTSISPYFEVGLRNNTASVVHGEANISIDVTIESSVLNNPALINKATGAPFNGKILVRGVTGYWEALSLEPNQYAQKSSTNSRQCINGIVNLASLQSIYGLTAYQARSVFANPMSITLSSTATLENVLEYQMQIGFRLFGD